MQINKQCPEEHAFFSIKFIAVIAPTPHPTPRMHRILFSLNTLFDKIIPGTHKNAMGLKTLPLHASWDLLMKFTIVCVQGFIDRIWIQNLHEISLSVTLTWKLNCVFYILYFWKVCIGSRDCLTTAMTHICDNQG